MLSYLISLFVADWSLLNVFKYITFRSGWAFLTSLLISIFLTPFVIKKLKSIQKHGQPIREDGPLSHIKNKKGTPTMGGIIIVFSVCVSTLFWSDISNPYIWISLLSLISFAFIGGIDDYKKLKFYSSKGISARTKVLIQSFFAIIIAILINFYTPPDISNILLFPFFKKLHIDLGLFYIILTSFVIIGSSNAVNLTDGLDGLAIMPTIIVTGCYAIIAYVVGNIVFANYLQLTHIPKSGELVILCSSIMGAGFGFLWYNTHPASVFMGDIGSLALGAVIGTISVITKHEVALMIIGGLFVIETLSVIIQVISYKTRKKRVFMMAPIHHHFEKMGWTESQVVIRFWIISILFALIGLFSLKLR